MPCGTPLCPAGHLPHKGGDRLAERFTPNVEVRASGRPQPISPPVGEMPGRAEGGIPPKTLNLNLGKKLPGKTQRPEPPHPTLRATFSPLGRRGGWSERPTPSLFSPAGRRCRQADEGAYRHNASYQPSINPNTPYRHIVRIRAATSTRICCVLRSEGVATTTGHADVSKYCSSVTGMNRVRDA